MHSSPAGSLAELTDACLATSPPPPDAVEALCVAAAADLAASVAIPANKRGPLALALLNVPRDNRISALALVRALSRLDESLEALSSPQVLSVLTADVVPLAHFGPETPHDWAVADSALRTINNILLTYGHLRGPFADPPPPPGVGGAAPVLAIMSPVASLLESIFFPTLGDLHVVAQHQAMLKPCMKPHTPGPRGATSALDAAFLSARVLFLSTLFRTKLNKVMVHDLGALLSFRDLISVLTRIRTDYPTQPHAEPALIELLDSALSEMLRMLFNVSLYCTPEQPFLSQWGELLAIIVHFIVDSVGNASNSVAQAQARHFLPSYSLDPPNLSSGTGGSTALSLVSRGSFFQPPSPTDSTAASTEAFNETPPPSIAGKLLLPLALPLSLAINAMLNFPLGQLEQAWSAPDQVDTEMVPSTAWPPCANFPCSSMVVHGSGAKDPSAASTATSKSASTSTLNKQRHPQSAARRLAASLFARAQRHANPLKRLGPCSLSKSGDNADSMAGIDGTDASGTPTDSRPLPTIVWALMTLIESSLMRYFGPSSVSSADSDVGGGAQSNTSIVMVKANARVCAMDGIEDIEEAFVSLFSVLRKFVDETDKVRAMVRSWLFPSTLDRTVQLGLRTDFRGIIVRILSAPAYPQMIAAAGGLMLSVFDNDPQQFANEVGYGPSIGFLMSAGLAGGVLPGGSMPKSSSQGCESVGSQPSWDPITGAVRTDVSAGGVGGTGMSEHEAAIEADLLMGLMERMNRGSRSRSETKPVGTARNQGSLPSGAPSSSYDQRQSASTADTLFEHPSTSDCSQDSEVTAPESIHSPEQKSEVLATSL